MQGGWIYLCPHKRSPPDASSQAQDSRQVLDVQTVADSDRARAHSRRAAGRQGRDETVGRAEARLDAHRGLRMTKERSRALLVHRSNNSGGAQGCSKAGKGGAGCPILPSRGNLDPTNPGPERNPQQKGRVNRLKLTRNPAFRGKRCGRRGAVRPVLRVAQPTCSCPPIASEQRGGQTRRLRPPPLLGSNGGEG